MTTGRRKTPNVPMVRKYRYMIRVPMHREIIQFNKARLFRPLVYTDNHGVVTLEGLERQLLLGLDAHFP
jgi:hypothetical protein